MAPLDSDTAINISDAANSENESYPEDSSDQESDTETDKIYEINPSLRNARNRALMAEERWIIEMLKLIRNQRNALKVEALYYQGRKAYLYAQHATKFGEDSIEPYQIPPTDNETEMPILEPMFPDLSPSLDECFVPNGPLSSRHEDVLRRMKQLEQKNYENPSNDEDFALLEGQCNSEELQDLIIDHGKKQDTWDIGDPEFESDEEEWSQVNMDMSMLVGGSDQEDDD